MRTIFLFLISACLLVFSEARKYLANGTPYNVTYNHRSLMLNGSPLLLLSGSIHYPRASPGMWDNIMNKSKAAGIDVLETYVFWNLHEKEKGTYDFSGYADLALFLQLAQKNELYVNLRIGPYVCAEWNFGGFPEWLKEIPGMVFRTYNQPFMNEMSAFVSFITNKFRSSFADKGGPIILAQIENEYGNVQYIYGSDGHKYAEWAIQFALSLNIGVPWIMCQQGDISQAINTCNGFYCDNWIQGHWSQYPDQPAFWTENWPGWFQDWGQPYPSRPTEDVAFSVARWFARGGSLQNYYMWFGGTNFARSSGGPFIVTSYDYDVALDEYGLPYEPKYSHLTQLHNVIHQYEASILASDVPKAILLGANQEAHVYPVTNDENGNKVAVTFLSNIDTKDATVSFNGRTYFLPAWSVSFVDGVSGTVVFNTAQVSSQSILERFMVPVSFANEEKMKGFADVISTGQEESDVQFDFVWWEEPTGLSGKIPPLSANSPVEQISTTHDTTDYLWNVRNITLTNQTNTLTISKFNDIVHVFVDGSLISTQRGPSLNVKIPASNSSNHLLQILSITDGLVNYGGHLEQWTAGISGSVQINGQDITQGQWQFQVGLLGEKIQAYLPGSSIDWSSNAQSRNGVPLTWFKAEFDLPSNFSASAIALDLSSMSRGYAWINSNNLGRYWNITAQGSCGECNYAGSYSDGKCRYGCGDYSQRYYHVPRDWLQPTGNVLVLFEELGGDPTRVTLVERKGGKICNLASEYTSLALVCEPGTTISSIDFTSFGNPTGQCGQYSSGNCSATNSTPVVEQLCTGRSLCLVNVDTNIFGDPCPGVSKSLAVEATCK